MIANDVLEQWRKDVAPWKFLPMVEHDLILSRVLVEIYKQPKIAENLGTNSKKRQTLLHVSIYR
jgi:hypothetical protein